MFYEAANSMKTSLWKLETGENFVFPPHLHASFEWITVKEGCLCVKVDGVPYEIGEGEALLIFPHQVHSFEPSSYNRHLLCIFPPTLVKSYARRVQGKTPTDNRFSPTPFYTARIAAHADAHDDASEEEIKGILYALCAEFDRGRVYAEGREESEGLLAKIFHFVESNYEGACTLDALAAHTSYHYVYLSRYFKRCVGMSFTEYVNRYRINEAGYLLKNTEATVISIALDCGFDSLRSFNRNFKRVMGMTPVEYRGRGKDTR
jgi:AraC-like DNA-binding protein/mannose-6-phosphate isomerase-like protein (cupin superfamily)